MRNQIINGIQISVAIICFLLAVETVWEMIDLPWGASGMGSFCFWHTFWDIIPIVFLFLFVKLLDKLKIRVQLK
jgi:hypothetical protein